MSGGGLTLPASGGISDETVAFAAGLIDRSGKAPVIEAALAHRTGRPRPLPVRAVLTALLCLALEDRPLFLTDATRLLFCQISGTSRRMLGVTGAITTQRAFLAAYRRVRYCFGAIRSVMDPSALPKNRRLTQDDLKARTRPMTPAQAEAARGRLEAFINALLEASISVLTSEERAAYDGCTGLDATPVPLFSRGPSKRTGLCASDPDGGWYVREGDHREREDDKGKPLRKICLGPGGHHRHHGPAARRAARAPGSRHRPCAGPARARPRRHRRPGPGLCRRPRAQGRLARLRPRLHRRAARPIPAARPRPGLPAGHGLPDRPARHPGQHRRRHPGRGNLVLPRPARTADHRHHQPARPRHHPRPLRPADHRPRLLPAQAQRRPRRRRLPAAVLPRRRPPSRADLPAAPGLADHPATGAPRSSSHPPNRPGSAPRPRSPSPRTPAPATARTCPTAAPPGTRPTPPCATPSKASTGSSKTPPTKPSPSPPGAASAASPPSPSSPRCCSWPPTSARSAPGGPSPPATRPASPSRHDGDADQPARLPPRRLTRTSSPRHLDTSNPAGQPRPRPARSPATGPPPLPARPAQQPAPAVRARRHTKNQVTTTVLSV